MANHGAGVLAVHLDELNERGGVDQRRNESVAPACEEIALPVAGDGPILGLRGAFGELKPHHDLPWPWPFAVAVRLCASRRRRRRWASSSFFNAPVPA